MKRYLATVDDVRGGEALLVDVRRLQAYENGHIPGAVKLDIYEHHWPDTSPKGVKSFIWQMEEVGRRIGVSNKRRVIAIDEDSGMLAARMVWTLDWLGHPDVALLDGGMKAWIAAGGEVTKDATVPKRSNWKAKADASKMITLDQIKRGLKKLTIVDSRTIEEHFGTLVRAARGGTIPGAKPLPYLENLRDGKYKPAEELRAMYEALGVKRDDEIVPLCNGGYRSAHAYIALRIAGFGGAKNYYAAWQEWGNRPDVPIQKPRGRGKG